MFKAYRLTAQRNDTVRCFMHFIDKVHETADRIVSLCGQPICFEHILRDLFAAYELTMNFQQYALVGSTVRSYLAWLLDSGRLAVEFEDNMLLWRTC